LEKGRIVEMGPPRELLAREGFFKHIAELQEGTANVFDHAPANPAGGGAAS
jgi:hypothetical protein